MPGPSKRDLKPAKLPPAPERQADEREDEHVESEQEQLARESEKALDQALTRIPPG